MLLNRELVKIIVYQLCSSFLMFCFINSGCFVVFKLQSCPEVSQGPGESYTAFPDKVVHLKKTVAPETWPFLCNH